MQNTTHYALPTWERDDQIKMSDFNAMTAKLDAALKSNAGAVASEVTAREAADSAKADASALAAEVSARQTALAAETAARAAAVGTGGHNLRIAFGSYTGTGGSSVTLAAPFYPVLALVQSAGRGTPVVLLRAADSLTAQWDFSIGSNSGASLYTTLAVTWAARGVSWYTTASGASAAVAERAGNTKNTEYRYVLLGWDDTAEA